MSLAKRAARGAAFSIGTSVLSRALGLIGTLLVVRHVVPHDFGEVSAAAVLVATAHQLSALGVGMFLVTHPGAGPAVGFHAGLVYTAAGVLALGAVLALREPLGPLFDAPGLAAYVPGLVAAMFVERLGQIPEKLLVRDLRFGRVSVARTAGEVVYTALSVGLAVAGLGAAAIVWGNVGRAVTRSGILLASVSPAAWATPHRIDRALLGRLLGFGTAVSLGALAVFASRRWDNLVVSALFGPATLGVYALAYNLAQVPAAQVGEQISDVLVASFPRVEPAQRRRALRRALRVLAIVIFPMAVGLGVVARPLTGLFLDDSWAAVAPLLFVLSLASLPVPLCGAMFAYVQSHDRTWARSLVEWASVGALLGAMALLGALFGPIGAAAGVAAAFGVRYGLYLWLVKRTDGLPVAPFVRDLGRPAAACAVMAVAILGARRALAPLGIGAPGALAVEIAVGAVVYVAAAAALAPAARDDLLALAAKALGRARAGARAPA